MARKGRRRRGGANYFVQKPWPRNEFLKFSGVGSMFGRARGNRSRALAPRPDCRYTGVTRVERTRSAQGARSSAGEHYVDIVGVTGSIPVAPTIYVTSSFMSLRAGFDLSLRALSCVRFVQMAITQRKRPPKKRSGRRGCSDCREAALAPCDGCDRSAIFRRDEPLQKSEFLVRCACLCE